MRNYEAESKWRAIQSFLPVENQITEDSRPSEESLEYKKWILHIDHYMPREPKGTVAIFHGVGGNGRLLEFIAIPLWRAGFEVICPDMPLYGLTECGKNVSYNDWVDCGAEVCRRYRKEALPLFVFGLSAGGMLAYQTACRLDAVDGLLATCLLDQRQRAVTVNTASSKLTAVFGKPFLKAAHRPLGAVRLPMKAVCNMKAIVNDSQLARMLMSDPLSSGAKVSLEFLYGMLYPDIETEAADFSKCPVLLAHPENDRWTDVGLSRLFFDRLNVRKRLVMLPGAGHFPIEKEGLTVLENACVDFLNEHVEK